MDGTY